MSMIIALFDSDGTLYSNQFGRGLMKYAQSHGRGNIARLYYASLVPTLVLSKLKLGNPENFQRAIIERLGWLIKGYSLQEAMDAFGWVADEYLLSNRRADVIERVQNHQSQGHEVVIVSGMYAPALEIIGKRLGVTHLIGTQVEVRYERYTGRIIPPVIKGKDKVEKTREYLISKGWEIDWSASYAYGDSYTDRDMLELIGHPIAVYPDDRLNALAKGRNWEVLGIPKK